MIAAPPMMVTQNAAKPTNQLQPQVPPMWS